MKKQLFIGIFLLTFQWSNAQYILEKTINSWDHPNLSIERTQDMLIAGLTDLNPSTGRLSPMFKLTDPAGVPFTSFFLGTPHDVVLMDFTIKNDNRIVLVGSVYDVSLDSPSHLYIAETDFSGAIIQSVLYPLAGGEFMIPHQVVHSPDNGQVVVVGTKVFGSLTPVNYSTLPRRAFILGLDENNFATVFFCVGMDSPAGSVNDSDMLENITEVPGKGYFISGSANNPANSEQNLITMGIDYAGVVLHSHIRDNTNFRYAGASVLYQNSGGFIGVHVLANNSVSHQWEIASFDVNGNALTPFYSHYLSGTAGDINGFKLQLDELNQISIGGYIHSTSIPGVQLTPFLVTLTAGGVSKVLNAKKYQTRNNSPLTGYYQEMGNSVYINTPDILQYSPNPKKYAMVNQNSIDHGYDLHISAAPANSCEIPVQTIMFQSNPIDLGPANYGPLNVTAVAYDIPEISRPIDEVVVCTPLLRVQPALTVYPTPAVTALSAELTEGEILEISISDLYGKLVMNQKISNTEKGRSTLDVSKLVPGIYILHAVDKEGSIHIEKFMKE